MPEDDPSLTTLLWYVLAGDFGQISAERHVEVKNTQEKITAKVLIAFMVRPFVGHCVALKGYTHFIFLILFLERYRPNSIL
tara:strand:+ start:444 stop:686 length:243 start_codon:yes stop_codon:yes gene_type:complete